VEESWGENLVALPFFPLGTGGQSKPRDSLQQANSFCFLVAKNEIWPFLIKKRSFVSLFGKTKRQT
jgi:hypothetical protein